MEKISQEPEGSDGGKVLEEATLDLAMEDGDFEQRLGLVDKIPLVKPYFKKKHAQRKLDAKCLRALQEPLLSTLLVAGDGVFVAPCAAAAAATIEKQATLSEVRTKDGVAAEAQTGEDVTSAPAVVATETLGDIFAPAEPSGGTTAQEGELFRDKSEEASLDLVFELLTQLQYHTHQSDGVDICADFLQGACLYGSDCEQHHTVLPYHWQIRRSDTHVWQSISDDAQEQLERLYCNPDNEQVRLKYL